MSWRRRRRMKKVKPGDGSDLALYRPWQVFSRSLFHIDLPDEDGSATSGESVPSGPARGGDHPARGGDHSGLKESASATSGIRHTYAVDVHFFADDVTDYSLEGMWDGVGEAVGSLLGSSGKVDSTASIEEDEGLLPKKLPRPPVALYRDGKQTHRSNLPVTFRVPDGVIDVEMSSFGLRRIHYIRDDGETFVLQPDAHSAEGLREVRPQVPRAQPGHWCHRDCHPAGRPCGGRPATHRARDRVGGGCAACGHLHLADQSSRLGKHHLVHCWGGGGHRTSSDTAQPLAH